MRKLVVFHFRGEQLDFVVCESHVVCGRLPRTAGPALHCP